jgi:hypothetical protein
MFSGFHRLICADASLQPSKTAALQRKKRRKDALPGDGGSAPFASDKVGMEI